MTRDFNFIREAIAADDQARRDYDAWTRRRATQQPKKQREKMMEPDADEDEIEFMDRCESNGHDRTECQDWWDESRATPKSHTAAMNAERSKGWNDFVKAHLDIYTEKCIGPLAKEIAEVTVAIEGEANLLRKKVEGFNQLQNVNFNRADERINSLAHELRQLRAEVHDAIETLRGEQRSGGGVIDLPDFRRGRDAA